MTSRKRVTLTRPSSPRPIQVAEDKVEVYESRGWVREKPAPAPKAEQDDAPTPAKAPAKKAAAKKAPAPKAAD